MLLSPDRAEDVFRKIKHMKEDMRAHCLAPDRARFSIDDFHWRVQACYSLTIDIREVQFEGVHVLGMLERFSNRARILVRSNLADAEKRFTAVKELCHVVIDSEEDWSPAGVDTIESLMYEVRLTEPDKPAEAKAQSEIFAQIAAIEMVYDYVLRPADRDALKQKTTTQSRLALELDVPPFVVGSALSANHQTIADFGWSKVGLPGT